MPRLSTEACQTNRKNTFIPSEATAAILDIQTTLFIFKDNIHATKGMLHK
jgi:hypothetical protein